MKIILTNNRHVTGGDDEFTIEARNVTLNTCDGDNYVDDNGTNSLIQTGDGSDTVRINDDSKNATVEVGDGDALIEVWSPNTTTIIFGDGDTSIDVCANTNLILNVGVNEDYELNFYNGATANVTLTDGEGSYTVRGTADKNIFEYSGGDLVIVSCGGEDSIRVRQKIGAACVDGDDVCIPVEGGGSITVKNGRGHALNVNGRKIVVGQYAHGKSPQDVIKNFMSALTQTNFRGMKAVDDAIKKVSPFKSVRDVVRRMVKDCKQIDDADTFLRDRCNIFVDSADTGSITGWDAGNSSVKTAESIVAERGAIKTFRGDSFTVNGLKVILPDKKLSAVKQNIVNGLFTWWIKDALNLIEQSYGKSLRFDNPNTSTNEINVIFHRKGDALSSFAHLAEDDGRETEFDLKINLKTYGNVNLLDANGSVKGGDETFLDRTIAHELTHASMAANIRFYSELPAWLVEGAAELTHGISDENRADLETLANDWDALEEILLNDSSDADDLEFDDIDQPAYAGGFIFLHYFAKKVADMIA